MTCEEIIATVAAQRKRLDALSVRELALFGSYARNEAREDSDLDFLVEFEVKSFGHYMDLKEFLESLFGRPWISCSRAQSSRACDSQSADAGDRRRD
jgi:hypothetical protein